MTRVEFLKVAAYVTAGTGKTLSNDAMEVYFDLLGDLPYEVLLTAARRVVLEHKYATFPSVAELREAAAETVRGEVKMLSPAEAWDLAWTVAAATDPEVSGSLERAIKKFNVPPIVVEAIKAHGLLSLCYGKDPVGVVRGQFMKVYEQLAARDKREALMPPAVKNAIAGGGVRPLPEANGTVKALAAAVCKPPPGPGE